MPGWLKKATTIGVLGWLGVDIAAPVFGTYFIYQRTGKFLLLFDGPHGSLAWHEYWTKLVPISFVIIVFGCIAMYGAEELRKRILARWRMRKQ